MKKISVRVKTQSKSESVKKIEENCYEIKVGVPPIEGKANERIRELLALEFNVSKSKVVLLKGQKSKQKVFAIDV